MRTLLALAIVLAAGSPALAAGPTPSPTPTPLPMPINGVTVDLQQNAPAGAARIERPPLQRSSRKSRNRANAAPNASPSP